MDWALVAALLIQTGALFYWGGTISRAVKEHDRRLDRHEERLHALEGE